MSDEVRAATERLRRVNSGESLDAVYGPIVDTLRHVGNHWLCDRADVANAHLAEHPADEAEPVTVAWLRTLPGCQDGYLGWPRVGPVQWFERDQTARAELRSGLPVLPTRGHVRRLLAALGVL